MRILFAVNSLGAHGGMERVTIVKANAFAAKEGVEVAIAYTDKGTYPQTLTPLDPRIKVIDLGVPFWDVVGVKEMITRFPGKVWRSRKALKRVINDFKPDVVITTGSYERFALGLLPAKVTYKTSAGHNKIVKIREFHFASDYRSYLPGGILSKISAKIMEGLEKHVFSRFFTKTYLLTPTDLEKNFKGNPRFDYMMNPITLPSVDWKFDEKEKTIIAVGRIVYQKNFESLIRVWSKIESKTEEWNLRILGGTEYAAEKLLDYAKSIGCERVEVPGWCKDVNSELKKASIVCMTSRYEGNPLALLEGLNAGVVPISYDLHYGPSDIIENGKNGILVPYLDEEAMANALLDLIHDQKKRQEMALNGEAVVKQLTVETITDQWIEKYNELMHQLR